MPKRLVPMMASSPVITSMVAERWCGSMPITTRSDVELTASSDARSNLFVEPGRQRYFEQSKPLLSLSPLWATLGLRRPKVSQKNQRGQPM